MRAAPAYRSGRASAWLFAVASVLLSTAGTAHAATGTPDRSSLDHTHAIYHDSLKRTQVVGGKFRDNLRIYQSRTAPGRMSIWNPAGGNVDVIRGPQDNLNCRQARRAGSWQLRNDMVVCPLADTSVETFDGDDLIVFDPLFPKRAHIEAGYGEDVIRMGNSNPDQLFAHEVFGGWGNDIIFGSRQTDLIYGGDDRFATEFRDSDNDTVYAQAGADFIYGDDGNDTLWGGSSWDVIFDDERPDTRAQLQGAVTYGGDTLIGGIGHDNLITSRGSDRVHAREGELRRLAFDFDSGAMTMHELLGKPPEQDKLRCGQDTATRLDQGLDQVTFGTCRGEAPPL